MFRKYITEKTAVTLIALLLVVTLAGALLFFVAARTEGHALQPTPAELSMQDQQRVLAEKAELEEQILALEAQLAEAEQETRQQLAETERVSEEMQTLETTREELFASMGLVYQGDFHCTAYCCEEYPHICGGNGVTASGTKPTPGITVAADWGVFPAGTWIYIEGVGLRRVEDTGSAIKGNRIDVAIDTHDNALRWGGQGSHGVWVFQ